MPTFATQQDVFDGARAAVMVVLVALLVAPAADGRGPCDGEGCSHIRPEDQLLLLNVRPVGCSTNPDRLVEGTYAARLHHADGHRQWVREPLKSLLASVTPDMQTVLFVHGNRVENGRAALRGLWVYERLVREAPDPRPIRFIIFSWPSSEIKGILRDVKVKAARTRPAGWQLAWMIDRMPSETPLGMFGYSFGSRIVCGASHILGGGSLGGLRLNDRRSTDGRPMNAVFVAAAYDSSWMGPGRYHSESLSQIDQLLVTANQKDPAMRLFPLLNRKVHPRAMGLHGPTCLPSHARGRVKVIDVTRSVGRTHNVCLYLENRRLMARAWRLLLFADSPTGALQTAMK